MVFQFKPQRPDQTRPARTVYVGDWSKIKRIKPTIVRNGPAPDTPANGWQEKRTVNLCDGQLFFRCGDRYLYQPGHLLHSEANHEALYMEQERVARAKLKTDIKYYWENHYKWSDKKVTGIECLKKAGQPVCWHTTGAKSPPSPDSTAPTDQAAAPDYTAPPKDTVTPGYSPNTVNPDYTTAPPASPTGQDQAPAYTASPAAPVSAPPQYQQFLREEYGRLVKAARKATRKNARKVQGFEEFAVKCKKDTQTNTPTCHAHLRKKNPMADIVGTELTPGRMARHLTHASREDLMQNEADIKDLMFKSCKLYDIDEFTQFCDGIKFDEFFQNLL